MWTGEGFEVPARARKSLDASLVCGMRYSVAIIEERSAKAHAAYFATVTDAWRNLPEDQVERFPTADHLRRYALIKTGHANRRDVVCANNNEAMRLAALVKTLDPYSLTMVSERAVAIWTAESQSYKAMGKKRFMQSQEAVRDFCASLIGVTPETLERESGQTA
jgi:hypothetical protein